MWTAAILAGGQGRRLGGRDKSALRVVGASSILDRQLSLVRTLTPHVLIIGGTRVPGEVEAPDPHDAEGSGIRRVEDLVPGAGALGGLYTALVEARTEQVLVIACDMPFVSAPLLHALAAAGADADVAMPRDADRRHPLCASYQRRVAPHLKNSIDAGALRIADALGGLDVRELGPDELAALDRDGRLLLNVNTPDDYEAAVALAKADSRARIAANRDA